MGELPLVLGLWQTLAQPSDSIDTVDLVISYARQHHRDAHALVGVCATDKNMFYAVFAWQTHKVANACVRHRCEYGRIVAPDIEQIREYHVADTKQTRTQSLRPHPAALFDLLVLLYVHPVSAPPSGAPRHVTSGK